MEKQKPKKWMTAEEARVATFRNMKANAEADLEFIFPFIKKAVEEGKYDCEVQREESFSTVSLDRLTALGYKVEWGKSLDGRNETYTDKGKIVISWA